MFYADMCFKVTGKLLGYLPGKPVLSPISLQQANDQYDH